MLLNQQDQQASLRSVPRHVQAPAVTVLSGRRDFPTKNCENPRRDSSSGTPATLRASLAILPPKTPVSDGNLPCTRRSLKSGLAARQFAYGAVPEICLSALREHPAVC